MADRFPSIEDFDEGDTEVKGTSGEGADTAEDFLARERAILGDDADMFGGSPTAAGGEGDLLGGVGDDIEPSSEQQQFESSFPSIDTGNDQVGPDGTITGSGISGARASPYNPSPYGAPPEEEPEPVREWRERRNLALEHRAEQSAKKREATIKEAQQNIDDFYENYNNKKDKTIAQTRKEADEFLANRDDTTAGGTSWERIAKLVDLSGKGAKGGAAGTGKEKFREMLADLRKDKDAPGSSGV